MPAKVYLVGAGPGDPGLITVKGAECLRRSDVIIYDYLAAPRLLEYGAPDAQLLYVGKKGGDHTLSQTQINALLVEKALAGHTVTRLKGGDPFLFGRGGEEVEALIERGIAFEVVPGVTSAVAAPAYAGIPLTHRKFASTVTFVTGHEDPLKIESSIDWEVLARSRGTLVFVMGVKNLANITRQLLDHGMSGHTPAALIRWGTTPRQVVVSGTLADIGARAVAAAIKAPAVIVVGEVVALRDSMHWFEDRPLLGKRVVVTRAREQASDLVAALSAWGAECLECPSIRVAPPADWSALDTAIDRLADYHWLVFTSVNGVNYFFQRLFARDRDARALGHLRTAVIGPATARRLREFGVASDIIPHSYRAESVVDAFRTEALSGCRVLLPRASESRPVLPLELQRMGAHVDEMAVYCTLASDRNADLLLRHLADKTVDLVTFTSSSTVRNFHALLPADQRESLMQGVAIASIGPVTADTASALGYHVDIVSDTYTIPGLCRAILAHYTSL